MKTSEQTNEIAAALAKAQGSMKNPEKNKTANIPMKNGGKYSYNYADLPNTFDTVRASLSGNGLSHTFATTIDHQGGDTVCTCRLSHSSGQWYESEAFLPGSSDIKGMAANLTYLKRYLFSGLVGVAGEDDMDSEPESSHSSYEERKPALSDLPRITKEAYSTQVKPNATIITKVTTTPVNHSTPLVTDQNRKDLFALAKEKDWTPTQVGDYLNETFMNRDTSKLSLEQYAQVMAYLTALPKKPEFPDDIVEPGSWDDFDASGKVQP